jgi:hypothetical protein
VTLDDLIPVPLGHVERLDDGEVRCVEQRFDLTRVSPSMTSM